MQSICSVNCARSRIAVKVGVLVFLELLCPRTGTGSRRSHIFHASLKSFFTSMLGLLKEDRLISKQDAETKANELLNQQHPATSGKKLSCPSCGALSIPAFRKFRIGPLTYTRCTACNAKISVPWFAVFAGLPFVGAILLAPHLLSFWLAGTAIVSGFVLYAVIHQRYVPLITKKP